MSTLVGAGLADAQDKVVVQSVAKLTTTISGQPIAVPMDNVEVTVSVYEIPPGSALPQHRHPHARYGYVLSGQLRVTNSETGKVSDFSTGDFVVESIGQWHSGTNPGQLPLKLLVIDQAPQGAANVEVRN